jgi:serine/threonine protein kinase
MTERRQPSKIVPGTVLAGRYRVDEWVMQEFEKATWRGVDTELGRTVGVRVARYSAQGYSAINELIPQVRDGPLPAEDAMDFVAQVADALAAVDGSGVVYRNVKRGVLRRDDGTFVLFDFHRARRAGSPDLAPSTISNPGDGPAAALTDIYDLGVSVYFLLTGRQPRPDPSNPWERPRGRTGQPPPPLVPLGVQSLVDKNARGQA